MKLIPGDSFGFSIEGIPVIIRFKTKTKVQEQHRRLSIEGIPVIIRFKTTLPRKTSSV